MAPRSVLARLDDINEAIDGIRGTLRDVSFEQFAGIWHLRKATERGLEIISEASRAVPEDLKQLAPDVPWSAIVGIGNVLRHDYQRVEPAIVWNIAAEHLDRLEAAVDLIRNSLR